MGMDIKITGMEELAKSFEKAAKKFPYSTEKVLKKEAVKVKKQIADAYTGDILRSRMSQPEWKKKLKEKKKTSLEKSFSPGKVIKSGKNYTTAVTTRAPHYHLVEEGHEAGGWYTERYSNAKRVQGKKIVAKIMGRRSSKSEEIGQRVLDDILKDAGL